LTEDEQATELEKALEEAYRARTETPEELFALMYEELKQVARAYIRRERADHTLGATALLNESYLKLFGGATFDWENRQQLFCTAARSMRRVLVDHARKRGAKRHGGEVRKLSLEDDARGPVIMNDPTLLLQLNEAIDRLAKLNPRQAQVVEMHSFAGLTEQEAAEVLGVSLKTVKNDWRFAKAWLKAQRAQEGKEQGAGPGPAKTSGHEN
jgi:RNA polymerase sigma factor (TIGR02999 family)